MKVLIVEDDRVARQFLVDSLSHAGFEVFHAKDGREALDILAQQRIPIVISDWDMPVMNGVELCQEIRQRPGGYTYFMLVTANNNPRQVVEGLEAGADDYLTKPFSMSELLMRAKVAQRTVRLEAKDMTIFALSRLVGLRSEESKQHFARVRLYTEALTQQLVVHPDFCDEIDSEFLDNIAKTSWLHDVGKIGIPDHILLKPGRLTDAERAVMETHTTIGAQAMQSAIDEFGESPFLVVARDIAASHHERFDGNGYPFGLSGNDIPLSGRIVALCDVYDALTSQRVYKSAYSHDIARSMIVNDSGTHFDPRMVDAFIAIEDRFVEISQALHDTLPDEEPIKVTQAEKRLLALSQ